MVKYKTTCPNCQMAHSVEITDRQRHETDFDVSLEYANNLKELTLIGLNTEERTQIAIAMYEQKCLDHRSNKIQKSKEDITRTINQAKKYK